MQDLIQGNTGRVRGQVALGQADMLQRLRRRNAFGLKRADHRGELAGQIDLLVAANLDHRRALSFLTSP